MESIISTFHIDWKIIIAQMVNFGVVFIVLYIYALKPLSKLMEERGNKISTGILNAKENEQILKDTVSKYEEALMKARIEANKICENGKKEAEQIKTTMIEEAKKQVDTMVDNGKKMIETEKIKMVNDAKKEIVSLVILATEKVLRAQKGSMDNKILEELKDL